MAKTQAKNATAIPKSMQVQLARLFGANSQEAITIERSSAEWRRTLKLVLRELDVYLAQNIDTDDLHHLMLLPGLAAANESLEGENFWPGYVEGITRVVLLLLGDYPDHRKRKPGRKKNEHYRLDRFRSSAWNELPRGKTAGYQNNFNCRSSSLGLP